VDVQFSSSWYPHSIKESKKFHASATLPRWQASSTHYTRRCVDPIRDCDILKEIKISWTCENHISVFTIKICSRLLPFHGFYNYMRIYIYIYNTQIGLCLRLRCLATVYGSLPAVVGRSVHKNLTKQSFRRFNIVSKNQTVSWFQTFAVFWMLCACFWVIPRRLNFIWRRFGTLCSIFIGR